MKVQTRSDGGHCAQCNYLLGRIDPLTPGVSALSLGSKWRHDAPDDPLGVRTWHKTDKGHRSAAFRRMRDQGAATAPTYQTVAPDDIVVCPRCGARLQVAG